MVDSEGCVRIHPTVARVVVQKSALPEQAIIDVAKWYMDLVISKTNLLNRTLSPDDSI